MSTNAPVPASLVNRPRVMSGRIPTGARFVVLEQSAEEKQAALLAHLLAEQKANADAVAALVAESIAQKAAELVAKQEAADLAAFEPHLAAARHAAVNALLAVWGNKYSSFVASLSPELGSVLARPASPLTLAQAKAQWAALPGVYLASANASR